MKKIKLIFGFFLLTSILAPIIYGTEIDPGFTDQSSGISCKFSIKNVTTYLVVGNVIYIGSDKGMRAVDFTNGQPIWEYKSSGAAAWTPPVLKNGVLYYQSVSLLKGCMNALEAATGNLKWKQRDVITDNMTPGKFAVEDGCIYFKDVTGDINCFDALTGEKKWSEYSTKISSTVAVKGDSVIFAGDKIFNSKRTLINIYNRNGKPKWVSQGAMMFSNFLIVENNVFFWVLSPGLFQELHKMDIVSGQESTVYKHPNRFQGPKDFTVHDDIVYYNELAQQTVYAVDLKTGAEKWHLKIGSKIFGGMLPYRGKLYFGSNDKYLYAVDIASGKLNWRMKLAEPMSNLEIGDNTLYFVGTNRTFYAIEIPTLN